jgi:RNA polymerase sigma-70 factor (ECF subfamily)
VSRDNEARLSSLHELLAVELLNYFLRRVTSREDAADLLADTFLAAWRHIASLPKEAEAARMWMFVTARNVHHNHQRGTRRRNRLADQLRLDLTSNTSEAEAPIAAEELLDVRAAVRDLPEDQRELVMLIHWEGFTLPEASRVVGIRESTARGRYQRARATLHARLETEGTTTHV